MRIFLLSLLLLFTLVSGYGDGIIVLDRNNFDDVLSQVKFVMVEFYLPGCTSCQEFGHEYAKAAQRLSIYPQIKFFEIDGNTEDSLVSRYNIQTFPTTKFFVRGSKTPLEYDGAFKADDIVAWVKDKYDKVSMEVKSPTQVQKYVRDNNLVGLFIGSPQSDDFKAYSEAARHFEDVVFINSDNEAVRDTYGVKDGESGFILFTKFDEGKNVYTGSFNSEELANFIKLEKYQAVMPFNQDAVQRIFYEGEEAIFLFKSKDTAKEIEEAFETAARDLKDRFVMTVVNFEDDVQLPVTDLLSLPLNQLLGIDMDVLPAIRLVVPKNKMRRYSLQGPITVEGIKTFIDEFENDKLQILA